MVVYSINKGSYAGTDNIGDRVKVKVRVLAELSALKIGRIKI